MDKLLFFLVVGGFIFAVDFYAYQAIKTVFPLQTLIGKTIAFLFWGITAYLLISIVTTLVIGMENIPSGLRKLTAAIFFFGLISKFLIIIWLFGEDIIRSFKWLSTKVFGQTPVFESRRKFISQLALISSLAPIGILTYGVVKNAYNYQFHKLKLQFAKLPTKFKGFKIVQLSDIHAGTFTKTKPIEKVVEEINALQPDLILFTGDLVNDLASEMDDYKSIFSRLKAKHGVYSVLGNHDYGDYAFGQDDTPAKAENFKQFLNVHQEMGWRLLRNENTSIQIEDQKIHLIGVENISAKGRFRSLGDLGKAYGTLAKDDFKILLSHDPSHWDAEVNQDYQDIDLTLSGHTHGFQFGIETKWLKWSPSQFVYKQWAGIYQKNEQFLYVNRGFGNLGYPGRVGILPEVTVIEIS